MGIRLWGRSAVTGLLIPGLSFTASVRPLPVLAEPGRLAIQRVADQCQNSDALIYHAEKRYMIRGRVRACQSGIYDATSPPYAAKPGERVMVSACRVSGNYDNAVMRARMNTAYFLNPANPNDMNMVPYAARAGYRWDSVARALPFVPTKIYDLGRQQGYPVYGYGQLAFLPSRKADAAPLNAKSIIISIDGCSFSSPDAIVALMANPGVKDAVEVVYYQVNENPAVFRRAFIPMYPRSAVGAEWAQMTRTYPLFERDRMGQVATVAAALGFSYLIYSFSQSSLGQALSRSIADCRREAQTSGGMILC